MTRRKPPERRAQMIPFSLDPVEDANLLAFVRRLQARRALSSTIRQCLYAEMRGARSKT